jgi:hypothetical protein
MSLMRTLLIPAACLLGLAAAAPAGAAPADYPTETLADYVFACMATNGETREALQRCSCSIDEIAKRLPFEEYEKAETVLSFRQLGGGDPRTALFRGSPWSQAMVDKLRNAQLEAELKCF